ncbi:MAG: hypothetical protein KDN22_20610 [Verrucomicrobiae bacterium]|nr:hypothetical protein [Verrucomicrobiae bacterium]
MDALNFSNGPMLPFWVDFGRSASWAIGFALLSGLALPDRWRKQGLVVTLSAVPCLFVALEWQSIRHAKSILTSPLASEQQRADAGARLAVGRVCFWRVTVDRNLQDDSRYPKSLRWFLK